MGFNKLINILPKVIKVSKDFNPQRIEYHRFFSYQPLLRLLLVNEIIDTILKTIMTTLMNLVM